MQRTRQGTMTAAAIGAAAGALSGLFGVGGGILIVPGFVLLLGMAQRRAHATSLAAILPIAAAGAAGYVINGSVNWAAAGALTAGGAVGALVGTRALRRIPERGLRVIFAAFMLAAAAALPFEVTGGRELIDATAVDLPTATLLALVGVLAGTMAGLLGVGGGIVMVPGLALLASAAQAIAKGTSLVVIIPMALVGTARNLRAEDVDVSAAVAAGAAGVASSFGASFLSVRMDPLISAVLFGVLLVAMAVRLLLAARGRPVPGDEVGPETAGSSDG
ncbi:MAG TPA: sulfite exporter TauE/SafE family protein [Actinomycetota bacterium]|nr:sulfite exporter TauE/SafE family protein [Actinomycetota bacterium]